MSAKKGLRKRFYIDHVKSSATVPGPPNLYYMDDETEIMFNDAGSSSLPDGIHSANIEGPLTHEYIGGLLDQIQELNMRLKRAIGGVNENTDDSHLCQPNESILIHGFEGTGKSLLLKRLEQAKLCNVAYLTKSKLKGPNASKKEEIIRAIFKEARIRQPSLVLMDDINKIASVDDETFLDIITEEIDSLVGSRVLVVATCRSISDVNSALLKAGRFVTQIELPVPDQQARIQILDILIGKMFDPKGELVTVVSGRTHGFTGSDLAILVQVAKSTASYRSERRHERLVKNVGPNGSVEKFLDGAADAKENDRPSYSGDTQQVSEVEEKIAIEQTPKSTPVELMSNGHMQATAEGDSINPPLTIFDFDYALTQVRPTALREIIFEPPKTTWADIGGSQDIQKRLDKIILWPLKYQDEMDKLNKRPKKGVLLYGPPGCSKTLTAQAVATKYGLNFIAIKGGELISMYVGESERAIRDLFRKARAAKPCVIFFDEIDSIASVRESTASKGLNVLTTLLTEMDGFNSSEGVVVLAATNQPQVLDQAIMRPGRFDAHIYLGLPALAARREILTILSKDVQVTNDVDFDRLARDTEGYTGAEIAQVYELATDLVLDRRTGGEATAAGDERLGMADFEAATKQTPRQVSAETLAVYEAFGLPR